MAALSTAYFLVRRKGALHPFAYQREIQGNHEEYQPSSLTQLCCEVLVRDSGFTKSILPFLPPQIFYFVMKAAVVGGHNPAVSTLLPSWPYRIFSLQELWPHVFDTMEAMCDSVIRQERVKASVNIVSTLIYSFLNVVRSNRSQQFRILDLRGFPTIDRMIHYLSHEVLTVESKNGTPEHEKYHVFVDCNIRDEDTFHQLHSALERCCKSPSTCKLHLHVSKMDASCLGETQLEALLHNLNPKELTGLCLQFNSLGNDGFASLRYSLITLKNITCFDISCNNLQLSPHTSATFAHVISKLPYLKRLDLSNNRVTNSVVDILNPTEIRRFEYLKLSACMLGESDLRYLSTVEFNPGLLELDLSENIVVTRHVNLVSQMFQSLAPTLQILELEECKFMDEHVPALARALIQLKRLRYLNLSRHRFTSGFVRDHISNVGSLNDLECIRLSYTTDCYDGPTDEDCSLRKCRLKREIDRQLLGCRKTNEGLVDIRIVWTELMVSMIM